MSFSWLLNDGKSLEFKDFSRLVILGASPGGRWTGGARSLALRVQAPREYRDAAKKYTDRRGKS